MKRVAEAVLIAALAAGCHEESTTADFTGINVVSNFDGALPVARLDVTGKLESGMDAFMPTTKMVTALMNPPPRRDEAFIVLLPAELQDARVTVAVDGVGASGEVLVAGSDTVRLRLGAIITASVALGSPAECGDGVVGPPEACDDANRSEGDGCDASCMVERGFVCTGRPSRCFDQASAVYADAAATCGGDGSIARPFCTLGEAVNAPRTAAVIVRPGLYREQVVADHVRVDIVGEPGAVLESASGPAIHVKGAAIVRLRGLVVRGASGAGGGVLAEGAGTNLDVESMEIGPGGEIGIAVRDRALSRIARTIVRGNAGGGIELDSSGDYRVENTVIVENGSATATIGGMSITQAGAGSRVVNVTIVDNISRTSTSAGAGVRCEVSAPVENSIIWGNIGGPPITGCMARYSDLGPFAGDPGPLDSNFSIDPQLDANFHLTAGSPCKDRGDPTGVVPAGIAPVVDFEGDQRPNGDRVDVGADEFE